jgi:hypothetical protein
VIIADRSIKLVGDSNPISPAEQAAFGAPRRPENSRNGRITFSSSAIFFPKKF